AGSPRFRSLRSMMSNESQPWSGPARSSWRWSAVAAAVVVVYFFASWTASGQTDSVEGVQMGEGVPTVCGLCRSSAYIGGALRASGAAARGLFLFVRLWRPGASVEPPRFVESVSPLVLARQFEEAGPVCRADWGVVASSIIQRVIGTRDK